MQKCNLTEKCPLSNTFCMISHKISEKNQSFLIISDSGPTIWHMSLKCSICPYKCKIANKLHQHRKCMTPYPFDCPKLTKIFFYNFQKILHMHHNILHYIFTWQNLHLFTSCFHFSRLCEISTTIQFTQRTKLDCYLDLIILTTFHYNGHQHSMWPHSTGIITMTSGHCK